MLLIDTSTEPPMAAARALYERLGYARVGLIPDHWGLGDGKLTFRRLLYGASRQEGRPRTRAAQSTLSYPLPKSGPGALRPKVPSTSRCRRAGV